MLIIAGFQLPDIPLLEVLEKVGGTSSLQNGPSWLNTGITGVSMTMVMVVPSAHSPASGVNVKV